MKRKTLRVLTGLLCAAMVFSNMAGMSASAMEEGEPGQEMQMQESVSGNDVVGDEVKKEEEEGETDIPEEPDPEMVEEDKAPETEDREGSDDGDQKAPEIPAEEEPEAVDTPALRSLSMQAYPSGKSFTVDGRVYNSADADEAYPAGDNITAYFFEADGLLYFDGTGPMDDWPIAPQIPWYRVRPDTCVIGEGITTVGEQAFYNPAHSPARVSLPSTLQAINDSAFYQCDAIEEISLPAGLKKIGERAFFGCYGITSIDIPEGVTDLGHSAFYECSSAASIHVPGSVREIKEMTFSHCKSAETITLGEGVEIIGDSAFQGIAAAALEIPAGVKKIDGWAFNNAKQLRTLTIPDSVTEIGAKAFGQCDALGLIRIGTGVASIGTNAFEVSREKKFTLDTENAAVLNYDWAADKRVIAYRLAFMDGDGDTVLQDFVARGDRVIDHAPEMEPYFTQAQRFTFSGWEPEVTEDTLVTGEMEFRAKYTATPRRYTVTFLDYDGTQIAEMELDYGADLFTAKPEDPRRVPEEGQAYTFSGWEPALTEGTVVTADAEYTAVYQTEPRKYPVVFKDHDGSILSEQELAYGTDIYGSRPEDPRRTPDERHTYTFSGWEPALTEGTVVTADAEYTAVYQTESRKYHVVFKGHDGSILSEQELAYGADIYGNRPEDPRRTPDERHTYTFSGWEPALTEGMVVTADAEYTAVYRTEPRKYHVAFKDHDGSILSEQELVYGTDIYGSRPEDPRRAPDERHTYTFSGWEPALTEGALVTADTEYTARYTCAERQYTLTFLDYDGTTLKEVSRPYGTLVAEEAPTPERAADGGHTYTFTGWNPALDAGDILTADAAYEAVYSSDRKQCRVIFQDHDGSVLKELSVPCGDTISGRASVPTREKEGINSYSFAGWQPALMENEPVQGDITYKALYTKKTQTGIAVEHALNHPSESRIGAADIKVYPVYEIYDPYGQFQEKLTDKGHPVEASDIALSGGGLKKGDNEVTVEQVSTGCTAKFHIYGSFIDGIHAAPLNEEVKAGSKISKFTVYFTRNRKEGDGETVKGIVDRKSKVSRYTLNNGASSVTVSEGDNEIRVTEKETGEGHSCIVHVTGVGKGGGDGSDPGEGDKEDKDKDKDKEPDGDSKGEDDKKPGEEKDTGTQPFPEPWQIVLGIPEKEVTPADIQRISVIWDHAGKEAAVPEIPERGPFEEILPQEAGTETEGTGEAGTMQPAAEGPEEAQEKEGPLPEEGQDGNPEETAEEGPQRGKLPLLALAAALAVLAAVILAFWRGRKKRVRFHGILTWEENPALETTNPKECLETVQEVIDRTQDPEECVKALKKSGAATYLPASSRMEVAYVDGDGEEQAQEAEACEKKLLRILSSIRETDSADVRIFNEQAQIDIKLTYRL